MSQSETQGRSSGDVLCGPLLRYTYTDYVEEVWHGSMLVVTNWEGDTNMKPTLVFGTENKSLEPEPLFSEKKRKFWRFALKVQLTNEDQRVPYELRTEGSEALQSKNSFWVPAKEESMHILFHSCNGYSLGVKEKGKYTNLALWKDILRAHKDPGNPRPFHVMVGGGDQVYSDGVRMKGTLRTWADTPIQKRSHLQVDKSEMEEWYFLNYCRWYNSEHFAEAMACIPAVQIFDDHDIIDGYGSYSDRVMKQQVFLDIGEVAWKYYMLFQHHTHFDGETSEDQSWVIGTKKGPYIEHKSRSICTTFGKRVIFYGLDCRVDRTLDRICYPETYNAMFQRLEEQVMSDHAKHLILLLGVPLAYPRLVFAEKFMASWIMKPPQLLNRYFGRFPQSFNKFDGRSEWLDDLADHWCSKNHKAERNSFMKRLQEFARDHNVRITILSGDVHLACVGRFFSKGKPLIPQNKDFRYMVNVISSPITNAPAPKFLASILWIQNKTHHFDEETDEDLMKIFDLAPNGSRNKYNEVTLPARNYCTISGYSGSAMGSEARNGEAQDKTAELGPARHVRGRSRSSAEEAPTSLIKRPFTLEVCVHAEIDPRDPSGKTRTYSFSIPPLESHQNVEPSDI